MIRRDDADNVQISGRIEPLKIAIMDQRAVLLVQRDRRFQLVEIALRLGQQIELEPHMPHHRGARAHRHRQFAPGLVTFGWPDMRAHDIKRQEVGRPALDILPVERVVAVRCPDTVGMRENTEVGPRAARRAGFDFDVRVRRADAVDQRVKRRDLGVGARSPVRIAGMVQIAVHVPFDIADGMIAQDGINALEQIFGNFGPRDVENILVAERDVINALDPHRPIGMGAIQIAVGIDHFGFEPDAHFHAEAGNMVDERLQAIGVNGIGYSPVAESRAVMAP